MHVHGLKFFLALIIIIGEVFYVNNYKHSYTSKFLFNEVADFDDIVEKESDDSEINLEKRTLKTETFSETKKYVPVTRSFSTLALPLTKSPLRTKSKIHDIKNRESTLFQSDKISGIDEMSALSDNFYIEPHLHQKRPHENVFEQPEVYMVNDGPPQTGYFIVKEKKPAFSLPQTNTAIIANQRTPENEKFKQIHMTGVEDERIPINIPVDSRKSNTNQLKTNYCKNSEEVRHLFEIPILERIFFDAVGGNNDISIIKNNKPLKYIIGKVAPRTPADVLDKPEHLRCLRHLLKKRRKRHATYVALRHKAKNRGHLVRRRSDSSDMRTADYKTILSFILHNKALHENFTFMPVLLATGFATDESETEVNTSPTQTVAASTLPTNGQSNTATSKVDNELKVSSQSTVLQSLNDSANKLQARSIAKELKQRIPNLKQTFMKVLQKKADSDVNGRLRKYVPTSTTEVTTAISSTDPVTTTEISTTNITTELNLSTDAANDTVNFHMIPGVLIYPKRKQKRLADDFSLNGDDNYVYGKVPDLLDLDLAKTSGDKYLDLNTFQKLKKDVSGECKNETDEILDALSELGGEKGAAVPPLTFSGNIAAKTFTEATIEGISTSLYYNGIGIPNGNTETQTSTPFSYGVPNMQVELNSSVNSNKSPSADAANMPSEKVTASSTQESNRSTSSEALNIPGPEQTAAQDSNKSPSADTTKEGYTKMFSVQDNDTEYSTELAGTANIIEPINASRLEQIPALKSNNSLSTNTSHAATLEQVPGVQSNKLANLEIPALELNNTPSANASNVNVGVQISIHEPNKLNTSEHSNITEIPALDSNIPLFANASKLPSPHAIKAGYVSDFPMQDIGGTAKTTGVTVASGFTSAMTSQPTTLGTSQNPISLSVASIPDILSMPPPTKGARNINETLLNSSMFKENEISTKLKRLESDLKLVNEVQSILNGMSADNHRISKREAGSQYGNADSLSNGGDTTTLFELDLKVVNQKPSLYSSQLNGLGKLLKWKAKRNKEEHRIRRWARTKKKKKKRRKKKKHKKPVRFRRFLGRGTQNFL